VSNVSFLAQTATWLPSHLDAILRRAWHHKGLSFVRILQRCPVYMPDLFGAGGSLTWSFLEHPEGIPVDDALKRRALVVPHDPNDLNAAQKIALTEEPAPMGLLYCNPAVPTYEEIRHHHAPAVDQETFLERFNSLLDKYTVQSNP
jgi:2-oxoglutarate ferredoxin oxidoreductase subunit beta